MLALRDRQIRGAYFFLSLRSTDRQNISIANTDDYWECPIKDYARSPTDDFIIGINELALYQVYMQHFE